MGILDRFRSVDNLSFKSYINRLKRELGPEDVEQAYEAEIKIPNLLLQYYPALSYRDIERMKWRDVKFRIGQIAKMVAEEVQVLEKMGKPPTKGINRLLMEPGWTGMVVNKTLEDMR